MSIEARELRCPGCDLRRPLDAEDYRCTCGDPLEVVCPLPTLELRERFEARLAEPGPAGTSGVWRYRELVLDLPDDALVSRGEGSTHLYRAPPALAAWVGVKELYLKHEGENPTGSFKDRGMTVAVTMARHLGKAAVACASTGNTSASMASYAALSGIKALVFIPAGKIAMGKLSQALAYGAHTLELPGSFDDAMREVEEVCRELDVYLVNSLNPFRIEGQKTIMIEAMHQLGWEPPDWVVVPGGNLGNTSAFGKGLDELHRGGLIPRMPRLATIQAAGANPFYRYLREGLPALQAMDPETIATAIRIGNPVSWKKAARSLELTNGVVEQATDEEILDAKARVDAAGIGAEPASCASVAGLRKLVQEGVVPRDARVVAILTGHLLKDPDTTMRYHLGEDAGPQANRPVEVEGGGALRELVGRLLAD